MRHPTVTPVIRILFELAPERVDSMDEFIALPMEVQRFTLAHWVWSMEHATMWGPGLLSHFNFIQWDRLESEEEADFVPGVTFMGRGVRRSEW